MNATGDAAEKGRRCPPFLDENRRVMESP